MTVKQGILFGDNNNKKQDAKYTHKIKTPQYKITGEKPLVASLCNDAKCNELINKIKKSNVTEEQKKFLINAAKRHLVFNYKNIAEYYAHVNKEMQELMEDSALVIIDFDDAIANGYVRLSKDISEIIGV
jgi:hypothetical protein